VPGDLALRHDVLAVCVGPFGCSRGAIFVPEEGPMGDEWCLTVEQARATGVRWTFYDGRFLCPECAERLGVAEQ
jgi:rubredoxin